MRGIHLGKMHERTTGNVYLACAIHRKAPRSHDYWGCYPHARGSTIQSQELVCLRHVYPACEDPPETSRYERQRRKSTPHARGSTLFFAQREFCQLVYPACAGIHPQLTTSAQKIRSLPRMRGDPPLIGIRFPYYRGSTPHARGSTSKISPSFYRTEVYPACAGIHLASTTA